MPDDVARLARYRLDRALFAAWYLAAIGLVVSLILDRTVFYDSTSCELLTGSSFYGEPKWGWFPLGTTCTYEFSDLPGRRYQTGPAPALVWLQAAVLGSGVGYLIARARARERRAD